MTLDDEEHARRHFEKKISEKVREGYAEVALDAPQPAPTQDDARLLDVMRAQAEKRYAGAWDAYWTGYEPVEGHEGAFVKFHDFQAGPGPFYEYLVLSEDERRGLEFVVKKPGHDPARAAAFLEFVRPRVGSAFDGAHRKVRLPSPIGRFDHVLFCGPSLSGDRYDGRLGRVALIFDCEIGDADTETFVEARLKGRDALPSTSWDREPFPVIDLRFDLRSDDVFKELNRAAVRERKFSVYPRPMLERGLRLLSEAVPESRLEIRNFRGEVVTLTRADLAPETPGEIDRFLLGAA